MAEPLTMGGIVALLVNAIVMGIREWKKSKTWKKNGTALEEIKKSIVGIDKSMGIIQSEMANLYNNCEATVSRFTEEISSNRDRIFDMAKGKGK